MSMDNMVPEIRFEGFSTNWLNFNLSQITDVYDGTHQTPAYTKSGVMFLSAENIKSLTSTKFISEEAFKKEFKVYPKKNDVLMTRIGDVGTANVVETDDDRAYYVTLALLKYKKISPYFLKSSIASPFVQKDIWLRTLHIAFPKKINMNEIKKVAVNCPPDVVESDKIGQYFKNLDALINQHQQKHDKLSSIKKAMLEKMFPKPGKTIPEIRFKGFSGEWEEKELGELAEIVRGASPRPIEDPKWFDSQSSVGWLRIRDVTEQDGRIHYLEQRISKLGQEKTRVLYEKHLLLSIAASVGKPVVNYVETGVHDGFLIFKKPLFELEFMYQWLKFFETKWQQFGQPGSQVNLNSDIVKSQVVTIPTNKEQTAIGNYFQKLDALINQHQQQIAKLNNIKQACLSKMFV
ncbi:type I restriction-modification system subunit S [Yersinia pseudotuberculosis]|uniref:restriction endonuclease subunit S n=1 Tax=Yersinia pseudotuberculosis TaxID=633 RepID=UPI0005DCE1A7|nr:restriction endonuclease subunit S [Yersinia pseudotuberculosis]CNK29657.1 type I restriction-modification system subunit S [Yersinia pseudotuberculosis]